MPASIVLRSIFTPSSFRTKKLKLGNSREPEGGGFTAIYAPDGQLMNEPLPETSEGIVYAEMQIPAKGTPKLTFDVGGQFPDNAIFAQIAPGTSLKISDVFSFFGVDVPNNFPDIELSTLSFFLWPG